MSGVSSEATTLLEHAFPLDEVCAILRSRGYKRVVLQFPDEHVQHSVGVYDYMLDTLNPVESSTNTTAAMKESIGTVTTTSITTEDEDNTSWIDVFITADSTYGSSVDDISAEHVSADVLVYFGSDLSSSGAMPVLVVPAIVTLDIEHCTQCLLGELQPLLQLDTSATEDRGKGAVPVVLLYEPGCAKAASEVYLALQKALAAAVSPAAIASSSGGTSGLLNLSLAAMPPCADLHAWATTDTYTDTQVLGQERYDRRHMQGNSAYTLGGLIIANNNLTDASASLDSSLDTSVSVLSHPQCRILYIGDKEDQLTAIRLQMGSHQITAYSPTTQAYSTSRGEDCRAFKERYGGVSRVKEANIVGLVIGSMGLTGDDTKELIERIQKLCIAANKKTYTFVMGRLNEAKLCNFPECDIFVFISNEDVSLIPAKTFHAPVLTPWELEIGLNAREWSSCYMASPISVLEGGEQGLLQAVQRVKEALSDQGSCSSDSESDKDIDLEKEVDVAQGGGKELSIALSSLTIQDQDQEKKNSKNNHNQIVEFSSPAGDFLLTRDYQGMNADVPEGQSLEVQKGKVGLAAAYASIL